MADRDFDVVVVGSGFGGSTAALRLTEKGYRVAVLEAGRRFDETTYPKTSWRSRSICTAAAAWHRAGRGWGWNWIWRRWNVIERGRPAASAAVMTLSLAAART